MVIIYLEELVLKHKIICIVCLIILFLPIPLTSKVMFIWAIINFVYYANKYESIFNPSSLFITMFLVMIACSQIKLTPIEKDDFTLKTWLTLFSVIVGFYLASYLVSRKGNKVKSDVKSINVTIRENRLFILNVILLVIELAVYGYIYIKVGGIPLQSDELRANVMPKVISGYIMSLAVFPSYFIIINSLYYSIKKDSKYLLFSAIFAFMIISLGGRINIILPLCTTIILISLVRPSKNKIKINKKIVAAFVLLFILLAAIPMMRTKDYSNNYYKNIYGYADNEPAPQAILPVWLNLSTNLYAFDKLVTYVDAHNDYQYGKMGLLGPFHFITKHYYQDKQIRFDLIWKDWLNQPTFLLYPYYDFGIFGAFMFAFIIGGIGTKFFMMAVNRKSVLFNIIYSYFCTSLLLLIFVNHFLRSAFYIDIVALAVIYYLVSKRQPISS